MVAFRDKMAAIIIKKADVWDRNSFEQRERVEIQMSRDGVTGNTSLISY